MGNEWNLLEDIEIILEYMGGYGRVLKHAEYTVKYDGRLWNIMEKMEYAGTQYNGQQNTNAY